MSHSHYLVALSTLFVSWGVSASSALVIERKGTHPITLAEWQTLCDADGSMQAESEAVAENPVTHAVIRVKGDFCTWQDPTSGDTYWFSYSNGRITVGAAQGVRTKAEQVARKLEAVLGPEN